MFCPDFTLFGTSHRDIINNTFLLNQKKMVRLKKQKGWLKNTKSYVKDGIIFHFQENRFGELDKLYIGFSPHKMANKNVHNASFLSFQEALNIIKNKLYSLGIEPENYKYIYISSMEIGLNFTVFRNPYYYLKAAVMFGNWFLKLHDKYPHYKFYESGKSQSKYLKIKLYIKSEQKENLSGKKYSELQYCDAGTLRYEVVLERAEKFNFFDFSNLENLFSPESERIFGSFLFDHFDKFFFFLTADVKVNNLTKKELKHYHQWQSPNYWQNLKTPARRMEKLLYDGVSKKVDIKNELKVILKKLILGGESTGISKRFYIKNHTKFLAYKIYCYYDDFITPSILNDKFCNPCFPIDLGNKIIFYKKDNKDAAL